MAASLPPSVLTDAPLTEHYRLPCSSTEFVVCTIARDAASGNVDYLLHGSELVRETNIALLDGSSARRKEEYISGPRLPASQNSRVRRDTMYEENGFKNNTITSCHFATGALPVCFGTVSLTNFGWEVQMTRPRSVNSAVTIPYMRDYGA